jgi:hypothetical protein
LAAQDRDLFADYRRRIREVLRKQGEELKDSLAALVSSLLLEETSIKIALISINRTGLRSSVLLSSPREGGEPEVCGFDEAAALCAEIECASNYPSSA